MMIVLLNGPLGIDKSTLAEALVESIEQSVMLDGDAPLNTVEESNVGACKSAGRRHTERAVL
jgi:hypothetical protein